MIGVRRDHAAEADALVVVDTRTNAVVGSYPLAFAVTAVAASPDGKRAYAARADHDTSTSPWWTPPPTGSAPSTSPPAAAHSIDGWPSTRPAAASTSG
jgi:hypothetical protein